ncbi:hypothetical protein KM043_008907 [Ampulex compressa]|nr:hypothetical protein KM043_008907 [Ampulex compressa]
MGRAANDPPARSANVREELVERRPAGSEGVRLESCGLCAPTLDVRAFERSTWTKGAHRGRCEDDQKSESIDARSSIRARSELVPIVAEGGTGARERKEGSPSKVRSGEHGASAAPRRVIIRRISTAKDPAA